MFKFFKSSSYLLNTLTEFPLKGFPDDILIFFDPISELQKVVMALKSRKRDTCTVLSVSRAGRYKLLETVPVASETCTLGWFSLGISESRLFETVAEDGRE